MRIRKLEQKIKILHDYEGEISIKYSWNDYVFSL